MLDNMENVIFHDATEKDITHVVLDSPGKHIVFVYNTSKDLTVELAAEGAEAQIIGLFVGKRGDAFQIKTTQKHSVPGALSDLLIKGIFDEDAQLKYEGLIRIEKGAHGSAAYQKNQNLMLASGAHVNSRPFLEILANDVSCTHGSTTGRINKDHVHYLQARGVAKKEAEKVISEGFALEVFQKLEEAGIVEEVAAYKKDAQERIYGS